MAISLKPIIERFMDKVAISTEHFCNGTPCWEWATSISRGYGTFFVLGKQTMAHRFSYEHYVTSIPPGRSIDHLCRNRACVNPKHLEAVTNAENMRRGIPHHLLKTHCPRGHPYSGKNLYTAKSGGRSCKVCARKRGASQRMKVGPESNAKAKEYMRIWRAANRDRLREYNRNFMNKDGYQKNYRARKRAALKAAKEIQ